MKRAFLYITNNLEKSTHEKEWDIAIFIGMTVLIVAGTIFLYKSEPGWVMLGGMWYLQAVDQIRHNRE